ncbi:MAG: hypothetical protein J1E43_06830 [Christensenellaceae bacterium]|nr:hypothetical protein [Christensenellaceae bacterium]
MSDSLGQAREILRDVTPLRVDCGQICGGACCRSLPGERTGMLLFPGEEAYYQGKPGYELLETATGPLVVCAGSCDRGERPLSCRLFPLLPVLRAEGVKVAMDARARAVCPLAAQGVRGLSDAFVEAVRQAGQALMEDETQQAFLRRLTEEQDELRALQRRFG